MGSPRTRCSPGGTPQGGSLSPLLSNLVLDESVCAGLGRVLRLQPSGANCHRWVTGSDGACVASSGSSGRRAASPIASSGSSSTRKVGQCGHFQPKGTMALELFGSASRDVPLSRLTRVQPWTNRNNHFRLFGGNYSG